MFITVNHGNGNRYNFGVNVLPRKGEWITIDGHRDIVTSVDYNYGKEPNTNEKYCIPARITITTGEPK